MEMESKLNLAKDHFELSLNAINRGDYIEAESELLKANLLVPNRPSLLTNLTAVLIHLEKWQEAEDLCKQLLKIEPNNAEGLINLGMCKLHVANNDAALNHFNRAIKIAPQVVPAWINKGNILQELEKFEEAELCLLKALELHPDSEEALIGMGNLHNELKEYDIGLEYFSRALAINPSNSQAQWNKALSLLRLGEFDEGWQLYESRWQVKGMQAHARNLNIPLWLGNESLDKKNILIHDEQGFGDAIQMSRYLPILEKEMGANIFFEVQKPLFELMQSLSPNIKVMDSSKPTDKIVSERMDYQCPIMSLPLVFKTTLQNIPLNIPYLFAEPTKRLFWQKKIESDKKLRVGITWAGSGHYAGKKSSKRDLPFEQVKTLIRSLESESIDFHVIQKQNDIDWITKAPHNLFFHEGYLNNFADSAALIAELDLVVSIDTAVGHLAGAIGQNVFLLIPDPPDFMSLVKVNQSCWYPKTQLIRQHRRGAWSNEQIKEAILRFISP